MATNYYIETEIMKVIKRILEEAQAGLPSDDPTRLRLIEIAPRSESFSDSVLSCYIAPNDPEDPDKWADEEITEPGKEYNSYTAKNITELGGGQYYNIRFTVHFYLAYNDLGLSRQTAYESSRVILNRSHHALMTQGMANGAFMQLQRGDINNTHMVRASRCVKKRRLIPSGSEEDTFLRGKMWLQFEVYMEG